MYAISHRNHGIRHMQDHPSGVKYLDTKPHRSLFERLTALISPEPENRTELLEILHEAHERSLIDADALSMIEGVFQVSDLSARDIMVPRSQMDVIDLNKPIAEWMPLVLETAHSRFPAVDGDRDKVVYATIHSVGLERDIPGAELVWVRNLGHKPDWIAPDLVIGAIEKASGKNIDLQAMARIVEGRIAGDAYNDGKCPDINVPDAELAPG